MIFTIFLTILWMLQFGFIYLIYKRTVHLSDFVDGLIVQMHPFNSDEELEKWAIEKGGSEPPVQ